MKTIHKILCALPLTLVLAGCPGEAEGAEAPAETTEAPEVNAEDIEDAVNEAANEIDDANADDALKNLENEVEGDGE